MKDYAKRLSAERILLSTNMGAKHTFGFSSKQYIAHLKTNFTNDQLVPKFRHKVRLMATHYCTFISGAAGAWFSFGATLLVSAYAARQMRIVWRQGGHIIREMERRGMEEELKAPLFRKRDWFLGLAVGVTTAGIAADVGLFFEVSDLPVAEARDHLENCMAATPLPAIPTSDLVEGGAAAATMMSAGPATGFAYTVLSHAALNREDHANYRREREGASGSEQVSEVDQAANRAG